MLRHLSIALLIGLISGPGPAIAQAPPAAAPAAPATTPAAPAAPFPPPTRDPHAPGYVKAKELPDGALPPANADGNFIIGPTHTAAPEIDRAGRRPAGHRLSTSP